ncbi:MAG TPA: hypothetical protein VFF65_11825 [Phycisphaerales bacterium]|nr:hypothetical protein [Phycisphaerales bacterium]
MKYVFASIITGGGLFVSFLLLGLLLASMPNGTPQILARIKAWMLAVAIMALAGLAGAVWAMIAHRPWTGAAIGAAPALFCLCAFIYLLNTEGP